MNTATSLASSKAKLLSSLRPESEQHVPYRHWNLSGLLLDEVVAGLNELPFAVPDAHYEEGNRSENNKLRAYFSGENLEKYDLCRHVADLFQDDEVTQRLADFTGAPIDGSYLRIEYAQDTDGFWLIPHTDIGAKFFTLLIYLNEPPPGEHWGTDIYENAETHHSEAPFTPNAGLLFVPGDDTWHGFEKRPITGVRRSLIVNYVTTRVAGAPRAGLPERARARGCGIAWGRWDPGRRRKTPGRATRAAGP